VVSAYAWPARSTAWLASATSRLRWPNFCSIESSVGCMSRLYSQYNTPSANMFLQRSFARVSSGEVASASRVSFSRSISTTRNASSEPLVRGSTSYFAFLRSTEPNFALLRITMPFGLRSPMCTLSAAGFIATRTSGWSPGLWMSKLENRTWNALTPGSVPAGARISAGKSGNVARSFPMIAEVWVN
jgi:hypothetical protein